MPYDPDLPILDEQGLAPADTPPPWGTESRAERLGRPTRKARDLARKDVG